MRRKQKRILNRCNTQLTLFLNQKDEELLPFLLFNKQHFSLSRKARINCRENGNYQTISLQKRSLIQFRYRMYGIKKNPCLLEISNVNY